MYGVQSIEIELLNHAIGEPFAEACNRHLLHAAAAHWTETVVYVDCDLTKIGRFQKRVQLGGQDDVAKMGFQLLCCTLVQSDTEDLT